MESNVLQCPEAIEQQIEEARQTLIDDIQLLEKETKSVINMAKEDVKKDLKRAAHFLDPRSYVLSHPWETLGCSVAAGVFLGRWFSSPKRSFDPQSVDANPRQRQGRKTSSRPLINTITRGSLRLFVRVLRAL